MKFLKELGIKYSKTQTPKLESEDAQVWGLKSKHFHSFLDVFVLNLFSGIQTIWVKCFRKY